MTSRCREESSGAYHPLVAVGCRLYAQPPCDRPATRRIQVLISGHATYAPEPFCDEHGPSISDVSGRSFSHVRSDELPAKAGAFELREVPL
jgi:hypothetical protein